MRPLSPTSQTLSLSAGRLFGVCCRGRRALSQNGNMYISGELSVGVAVWGSIVGIELAGASTQLMSWTGGFGYSNTISAAPNIVLLNGAITINLASVAQATTSMYFKYVNEIDFTLALQCTLQLNPGDFLGATGRLFLQHSALHRHALLVHYVCIVTWPLPARLQSCCASSPQCPFAYQSQRVPFCAWLAAAQSHSTTCRLRRALPSRCGQGDAQPAVQPAVHQER